MVMQTETFITVWYEIEVFWWTAYFRLFMINNDQWLEQQFARFFHCGTEIQKLKLIKPFFFRHALGSPRIFTVGNIVPYSQMLLQCNLDAFCTRSDLFFWARIVGNLASSSISDEGVIQFAGSLTLDICNLWFKSCVRLCFSLCFVTSKHSSQMKIPVHTTLRNV